jgi:hypothetical protein
VLQVAHIRRAGEGRVRAVADADEIVPLAWIEDDSHGQLTALPHW